MDIDWVWILLMLPVVVSAGGLVWYVSKRKKTKKHRPVMMEEETNCFKKKKQSQADGEMRRIKFSSFIKKIKRFFLKIFAFRIKVLKVTI